MDNVSASSENQVKPWYKKWWAIAIGAVVVVAIIGGATQGAGDDDEQNEAQQTTAPTATPTPAPDSETTPEAEEEPRYTFDTYDIDGALHVNARFDVQERFTSSGIKTHAQIDTLEAIELAIQEYPDLDKLWIFGTFPTTDQFGNTSDSEIVRVVYDRGTIDKINFAEIDPANVWNIKDGGSVHPDLED